jgi:hypothetical protein
METRTLEDPRGQAVPVRLEPTPTRGAHPPPLKSAPWHEAFPIVKFAALFGHVVVHAVHTVCGDCAVREAANESRAQKGTGRMNLSLCLASALALTRRMFSCEPRSAGRTRCIHRRGAAAHRHR